MKSWIFAFVGLTGLIASVTVPAIAQQSGGKSESARAAAPDQRPIKEVKFKIEWTGATKNQAAVASESITIVGAEGETMMSNNPLPSSEFYRRVTLRAESQPDGSYAVDVTVTESSKEQDIPRVSTVVKVRKGDTKVIQARVSKSAGGEVEYLLSITPVVE